MADLMLVPRRVPSGVTLEAFHVCGEQASFGRGAHCDWVLPDPQRLLSKRHCEITRRAGQWVITDLSSNGTTVGGKTLPPGVPQVLQNGDAIGCGSYLLNVVLETADADEATQSLPRGGWTSLGGASAPDLPSGEHGFADFGGNGPGADGGPVFDAGSSQRYGRSQVETLSIIQPFSFALSENESEFDLPNATTSADVSGAVRGGQPLSGLHDVFQPPRPATSLLPEDWDSPETRTDIPGIAAPLPQPLKSQAEPPANPFGVENARQGGAFPEAPAQEGLSQAHGPLAAPPGPDFAEDAIPPGSPPVSFSPPPVRESVRSPGPAPASREAGAPDDAVVAAFMRGAGIHGASGLTPEAFFEELGRTFRSLVVGLRRAMIARARVKGEFRIEQTMIQPFGNNPLKFAVDDDDALSALLGVGRRTGVSGPDAVADALRDIRVHEMAVTRAIEPAMREFLAANGPSAVLEQLSFPVDQPLSLLRRAKAWSTYVRLNEDLAASATETLDGTFGRAFGRAYEAARAEIDAAESRGVGAKRDRAYNGGTERAR